MDPEPNRFFLAFLISFLFIWKVSYAEQYYDPQTRRYIEIEQNAIQQPAQSQQVQRQKYPQRVIPTHTEIEINDSKLQSSAQLKHKWNLKHEIREIKDSTPAVSTKQKMSGFINTLLKNHT